MLKRNLNRRAFFKWNTAAALSSTSLFSLLSHLPEADAASIGGSYKALVCVFLAGGNDAFNTVVPRSSQAHNTYAKARQDLTVGRNSLLPINPNSYNDGISYGLHPRIPELQRLFNQSKLSIVANVGPLVQPISKAQYESKSIRVPSQLFSHSDQMNLWMTANAASSQGVGWAGKMADRFYPSISSAPKPSVNITTNGTNLWQTGTRLTQYDIPPGGVYPLVGLDWHDGPYKLDEAYKDAYLLGLQNNHMMVSEFAEIQLRSVGFTDLVSDALKNVTAFSKPFPARNEGELGEQLEMVAKLISVRDHLSSGVTRQIFYVRYNEWDTHADQNGLHPQLLSHLSKSLDSFYAALGELGMQNQVTTFTASEFGRSLTPNNDGTDHGWGGHSIVMGGGVRGGDIFGRMPRLALDSPDAVEEGRIIPTTAVDQYGATLASWFGATDTDLNVIFPNLKRFKRRNLGFMKA